MSNNDPRKQVVMFRSENNELRTELIEIKQSIKEFEEFIRIKLSNYSSGTGRFHWMKAKIKFNRLFK